MNAAAVDRTDLYFDPHLRILNSDQSNAKTCSRNQMIRRFIRITKQVVRIMNLQEPAENRLWFRVMDDRIVLYERIVGRPCKVTSSLVITYNDKKYFAPWIYDFNQLSARVMIYKENYNKNYDDPPSVTTGESNDAQSMYLVHRSYPNHELQHPGGHLEYIETGFAYDSTKGYYLSYETPIDLVRSMLPYLTGTSDEPFEFTEECITTELDQWMRLGASREVLEESGIDIIRDLDRFKLLKVGTTTFYFGFRLETNVFETGPQDEFKREIVDHHAINKRKLTDFDRFWLDRSDPETDHAWITSDEMIEYWSNNYTDHITELVNRVKPEQNV